MNSCCFQFAAKDILCHYFKTSMSFVLDSAIFWGVNQGMEDLCLFSLYNLISSKIIAKKKHLKSSFIIDEYKLISHLPPNKATVQATDTCYFVGRLDHPLANQ